MATSTGNNGIVLVADSDIVIKMLTYSLSEATEIVDDSAVLDPSDTHLVGTDNWSGSLNCYWDPADALGQEVLKNGTSVLLGFYPDGNVSGKKKKVGNVTISGLETTSGRNATNTVNFSFTGTGSLVETTIP